MGAERIDPVIFIQAGTCPIFEYLPGLNCSSTLGSTRND